MRIRTIEIGEDVAGVLRRATWEGPVLRLPDEQLDRKLYVAVDKVLATLGGKWSRGQRGHVFAADTAAELQAALDAGHVVDRKKTLELFETPREIAEQMALAARTYLFGGKRFLEPSAGRGRLLEAMFRHHAPQDFDEILAIDIDPANCDELIRQGIATETICGDFLAMACQLGKQADVILMNPPFGNTADIAHVTHAFTRWLAPGGTLVAIMSPHFTFAENRAAAGFKQMLAGAGVGFFEIEELPEGAFTSEGTAVRTVMVTIRKAAAAAESLAA